MVKINNQRERSSICWRGRRGTDNGRQKTRSHGYDVIVGGELFTDYSDHPRKRHAKPKTQINRRRTLPASFPLVGCLPQAAWPEDFSPKVRTLWHCSRLKAWRFTYDWSWWYPSGNRPLQQYLGFTAGRWLWSVEHKADSLIAKFKEAGGTVEEIWCMNGSHRDYLRSGYLHHRLPVMGWYHYRDNAITYKTGDKNARELKLANAAITDMQMRRRDVAALDAKLRRVSWC